MRITVGKKLVLTFLGLAAMTGLGGALSVYQIRQVNASTAEIAQGWLPAATFAGAMNADLSDYQRLVLRYVIEKDPKYFPEIESLMKKNRDNFNRQLATYEAQLAGRPNKPFEQAKAHWQAYEGSADRLLVLLRAGDKRQSEAYNKADTVVKFYQTKGSVTALLADTLAQGQAAAKQADQVYQSAVWLTACAILAMAIGAVAIGTWIARRITDGLAQIVRAAEGIAAGHLDQRVAIASDDELGDMARAFTTMTSQLRAIVGQVRSSASSVARAADVAGTAVAETSSAMEEMAASIQEVATSSGTLADNVEETSSSISEMAASIQQVAGSAESLSTSANQTSASVNEMSTTIEQVASHVAQAHRVALEAAEAARGGSDAVADTVAGMGDIERVMGEVVGVIEGLDKSSAEIGAIVALINDVARQTSLLALNATIEAARAGEQGRGFAVVADEVRSLAARSAHAAQEIAGLVSGIQHETGQAIASTRLGERAIAEGTQRARRAGEALEDIVGAASRVTAIMGEITGATQEQAAASTQIAQAAQHMTDLTRMVSGATREQARASEQINEAVEVMNRMTRHVSQATGEQKKSGDQTVEAIDFINQMSMDLQRQSQQLLGAIAFFKEESAPAPSSAPLTSTVPAVELAALN